ncbi:MAG TPA: alpha/beta fold hydrolase [Gammaproteobacteria bacterium]|nr:alpha/beta fold hydrolase [Gammaproteobacteria bacterium]
MIAVVTVHGLWMRGASMGVLRGRLAPHGFAFHAFDYPSVKGSLRANVAALAAFVDSVPGDTVHFVGHSLGGVLICALLEDRLPARLGRVVCLGAPLRGSRSAARLARWPGGHRLVGRCLADVQARGGFSTWPADVEVGSIAGRMPLGAGRLLGRFRGPNDGTVAVAETQIAGLTDHVVLPVTHFALLWSSAVAAQTEHFLLHARFRR